MITARHVANALVAIVNSHECTMLETALDEAVQNNGTDEDVHEIDTAISTNDYRARSFRDNWGMTSDGLALFIGKQEFKIAITRRRQSS